MLEKALVDKGIIYITCPCKWGLSPDFVLQNAVAALFEKVPEYKIMREGDEENSIPYRVFGDLAHLLCERIIEGKLDQTVIESFGFLNELAASQNPHAADLAIVGVFEVLTDDPKTIEISRKFLKGKAAEYFEKVLRGWKD